MRQEILRGPTGYNLQWAARIARENVILLLGSGPVSAQSVALAVLASVVAFPAIEKCEVHTSDRLSPNLREQHTGWMDRARIPAGPAKSKFDQAGFSPRKASFLRPFFFPPRTLRIWLR